MTFVKTVMECFFPTLKLACSNRLQLDFSFTKGYSMIVEIKEDMFNVKCM